MTVKIKWTLAPDAPYVCIGLFDSKEEAKEFKEYANVPEDMYPTMIVCDD